MAENATAQGRAKRLLKKWQELGLDSVRPNDSDMRDMALDIVAEIWNAEKRIRAEVLAACIKHVPYHTNICCLKRETDKSSHAGKAVHGECRDYCTACSKCSIENLQPAASDLEAHDDYVRKLRDLDWIREFPVVNEYWCPGFPEGVKPYLEALLREEWNDALLTAANEAAAYESDDKQAGPNIAELIHSFRREKARAEEKG